jgi:hypothetical protein
MKMTVFWVVALMMEAARTSETLVNFYQTTWCCNAEDSHLHTPRFLLILFYCMEQIYINDAFIKAFIGEE